MIQSIDPSLYGRQQSLAWTDTNANMLTSDGTRQVSEPSRTHPCTGVEAQMSDKILAVPDGTTDNLASLFVHIHPPKIFGMGETIMKTLNRKFAGQTRRSVKRTEHVGCP